MKKVSLVVATAIATLSFSNAMARDHIEIVGSSTVYPFSTVVAETFGKKTKFKTPKIESTGSGGGMKCRTPQGRPGTRQASATGRAVRWRTPRQAPAAV